MSPGTANDFLDDGGVAKIFNELESGPLLSNPSPVPPLSASDTTADIDFGFLLSGDTEGENELSRGDKPTDTATNFIPRNDSGDSGAASCRKEAGGSGDRDSRLRNFAPGPSWDDTDDKPPGATIDAEDSAKDSRLRNVAPGPS